MLVVVVVVLSVLIKTTTGRRIDHLGPSPWPRVACLSPADSSGDLIPRVAFEPIPEVQDLSAKGKSNTS